MSKSSPRSREELQPLLRAGGALGSFALAHHELPETELEVDSDSRLPLSYQHSHMLDQLEERGYLKRATALADPSTPNSRALTGGAARTRTPLYVTATIVRIAEIKTSESTFTLRVRLHLLWEVDLEANGLGDMIKEEIATSASPFYITCPSNSQLIEKILKAGVIVPRMSFMNSTSAVDADEPMMRVYPRPEGAETDMVYWNQMWDVTFRHDFQLESFPFDCQTLTMELNLSDSRTSDLFYLVVHAVQVRRTVLELHEWTLHVPRIARQSPKHRFVNIDLKVTRKPGYYLWNIVFILCSISCLIFTAFVSKWDTTSDRVSISLTLILTSVAFKFTVNESLPKLNYQTLLDRFMLNTQLSLCAITVAACAAGILENCRDHLDMEWLAAVDTKTFDRWMMEASFLAYAAVKAHWFSRAYLAYSQERGDCLERKHLRGPNPDTGQLEARQWLCFHFARTFFLPEHQVVPGAFSSAAWNA